MPKRVTPAPSQNPIESEGQHAQVTNSPGTRLWQLIIKVPWYFGLLILFGFLTIAISVATVRPQKYSTDLMGGQLNIVVAPFLENSLSPPKTGDLGLRVAQLFYSSLVDELADVEATSDIRIELRGPNEVPPLAGRDQATIDLSAQKLSEQINAHIIIYGVITYDDVGRPLVAVKFYVSGEKFNDALELLGENDLGTPILLTGDTRSGADLDGEHEELRNRVEVVSFVMKAISAYIGEDFSLALSYLERASSDDLWKKMQGKEVIYLLAGNTSSREALPLLLDKGQKAGINAITQAESYYHLALESASYKGEYARAYIGLAGVQNFLALYKSRLSGNLSDVDSDALVKEEEYLDQALVATYRPETADIEEKVAFNRAQVALLRYQLSSKDADLIYAYENYLIVIQAYESGNSRVREIAAHSHAGLAIIARTRIQPDAAIDEYKKAFELTHMPSLQALYLYHIGNVYYDDLHDYSMALEYYNKALDMREDLAKRITQSQIKIIESRVEELQLKR